MKKSLAAVAIAASTIGGVAAGATILGPGVAGAQDDSEQPSFESFADRLSEALQPLVDDGTIDEDQRDAVVEQLEASRPDPGELGPHHRGWGGPGFDGGADLAAILGIEPADMVEALRNGETLADLAAANGVDTQDLVDALVAAAEARVTEAVDDGRIDADEAAEILADSAERAADIVNGELPLGPPRGFDGPRGFRFGGPEDLDSSADAAPAA